MDAAQILEGGLPAGVDFRIESGYPAGETHVRLWGDIDVIRTVLKVDEILDSLAETIGQDITWHVELPEGLYEEKGWF